MTSPRFIIRIIFFLLLVLNTHLCNAQIIPIPYKIPDSKNELGISLDTMYIVNAEENNGRIGLLYTKFDKNVLIAKMDKYADDTITCFLLMGRGK